MVEPGEPRVDELPDDYPINTVDNMLSKFGFQGYAAPPPESNSAATPPVKFATPIPGPIATTSSPPASNSNESDMPQFLRPEDDPDYNPALAPPTLTKCSGCGHFFTVALKRCGRCKQAQYCDVNCQRKHWPVHKHECKKPEETEEEKLAKQEKEFKENFENPVRDTLHEVVYKITAQMTIMKLTAGTGSRKAKKSVKQEVIDKGPGFRRHAWAARMLCLDKIGSQGPPPPPPTPRDLEMYQKLRRLQECPYFPLQICFPFRFNEETRRKERVDLRGFLPKDFGFDDPWGFYDEMIPLLPMPVKTPLLVPFLTGKETPQWMSSRDLIIFYQKAWRELAEIMEFPDGSFLGLAGKRKYIMNAALGTFKLLNFHVQERHMKLDPVAVIFSKTNYHAIVHFLHVQENFLFSALQVDPDEDHWYLSPDLPNNSEDPKFDEVPGDVLKRVKQQIWEHYERLKKKVRGYPDFFDDYFKYDYKEDKDFPYKQLYSKKAVIAIVDLFSRSYKLQKVDSSEMSMMDLDSEIMDAIEERQAQAGPVPEPSAALPAPPE